MNIIDSPVANGDQLLIKSFEEMKKKEYTPMCNTAPFGLGQ